MIRPKMARKRPTMMEKKQLKRSHTMEESVNEGEEFLKKQKLGNKAEPAEEAKV